ncbi:serpentine type 7TM GPCR chemoreceptor srd domain-containing protein [Ditylenchus destructor]|uniref:Serpentine type 7TM GPCR chemoreceptor srd domain-containing protein n=1 Tax=Ditylenchus destructor TaxID=166010 RepID=A0AAD4MFD8_9BILA|nr:serpentine type 7TM GPCR chemoreceptor srd domain-containing protein [Ditylenchus destructor]
MDQKSIFQKSPPIKDLVQSSYPTTLHVVEPLSELVSFSGADEVHHIMETTVYSTSTVLNIYLLYLITYHSTFGIKLYKYLLTVDAGLDLIFGFIVLLSQPGVINVSFEGHIHENVSYVGQIKGQVSRRARIWACDTPIASSRRDKTIGTGLTGYIGITQYTGKSWIWGVVAFSCDGYFVMKLNGFVAGFSPCWDSFFAIIHVFFLYANVMWIPVQFVYRYLLLCKDNVRSLKTNVLIASFTIFYLLLCLVIIVIMCEVREEYQTVGKHIIEKNGWPMRSDQRPTYVVGSFIKEWRMITFLSLNFITSSFSIVTVIWCEKNISKYFREMGNPTNNTTRRMHTEFHRALLAMRCLELWRPHVADALFKGKRTLVWIGLALTHFTAVFSFGTPIVYNSLFGTMLLNPHAGYSEDKEEKSLIQALVICSCGAISDAYWFIIFLGPSPPQAAIFMGMYTTWILHEFNPSLPDRERRQTKKITRQQTGRLSSSPFKLLDANWLV